MHFGGFSGVGDVASMREESSIHPWIVFQFDHGTKFVMLQTGTFKTQGARIPHSTRQKFFVVCSCRHEASDELAMIKRTGDKQVGIFCGETSHIM